MIVNKEEKHLILVKIGERLKIFRISKNLTQIEFASRMGIDYKNMSKVEKGKVGVTEIMLYNLCNNFVDFDANYILTGKKKEVETAPTEGVEKEV